MQLQPVPLSAEEKIHLQAQLIDAGGAGNSGCGSGRIVFWNRFAERLYGWTEEEVRGRNIVDVLATPLLVKLPGRTWDSASAARSWSGEFLVQRRDGTPFMRPYQRLAHSKCAAHADQHGWHFP